MPSIRRRSDACAGILPVEPSSDNSLASTDGATNAAGLAPEMGQALANF